MIYFNIVAELELQSEINIRAIIKYQSSGQREPPYFGLEILRDLFLHLEVLVREEQGID
jgi:hypothetical protein